MRNNAWIALAIVGIIIAFALRASTGSGGTATIDVQEDGVTVVNNTSTLDFQTPLAVTDDGGDADISLTVNDCQGASDALTFDSVASTFGCNTIASTTALNVELNGTVAVAGTDTLDFLSPFNVTDDGGDAQIDLPLADDSTFIGSAAGVPTATNWPDCDEQRSASTYDTTGNAIGCQSIAQKERIENAGLDRWGVPGYSCSTETPAAGWDSRTDDILYVPIIPAQTDTFIEIGLGVTTAGAGGDIFRLGIYEGTLGAEGWTPDALVVDAGTVSVSTPGGKSIVISESLTKGQVYFIAAVTNSTSATLALSVCDVAFQVDLPVEGFSVALTDSRIRNTMLKNNAGGTGALADPAAAPDGVDVSGTSTIVRLRSN